MQNFAVVSHVSITERKIMEERLFMAGRLAAIGQAMEGLSHEGRKSLQRSQASIDLLRLHLAADTAALELLDRVDLRKTDYLESTKTSEVTRHPSRSDMNRVRWTTWLPRFYPHLLGRHLRSVFRTHPLPRA